MRATYYPPGADHPSQGVSLYQQSQRLMQDARMDFAQLRREDVLERDGHACQECGTDVSLEIHHKKPVWAWAIDSLIAIEPKKYDDLWKVENIHECNALDNLVTLCKWCHRQVGSKANKEWKARLRRRRVTFGKQDASLALKLVGWRHKRGGRIERIT